MIWWLLTKESKGPWISPGSTPDRPRIGPGSAPDRPRLQERQSFPLNVMFVKVDVAPLYKGLCPW